MNIQECDILNTLMEGPYINQRLLSEDSGHSLGVVNRSLKGLEREGYLDEQKRLTEKADRVFKEKAPRNAVILADGFGMRTLPDCMEIPKGLLEVRGEVLIERTIRQLHEAGIWEVYVVVGFQKERYEYLADTYGVELVVNPDYASDSTLYSLSLVLSHISNTYVIPCGVWCGSNPYHEYELYSWYMVSDSADKESAVRVNRKMELVSTLEQAGSMVVGIAYLLEEQASVVRERITKVCRKESRRERYKSLEGQGGDEETGVDKGHELRGEHKHRRGQWRGWPEVDMRMAWETVLLEKDRMIVWARVAHGADAVCLRTLGQLHRLEARSDQSETEALAVCSKFLGVPSTKLSDITPPRKGMTGRSFLFSNGGERYVVWIPREGTEQLAEPGREAQVYTLVSGKGICDGPVYISPEDGCRITIFPEGTRTCDPVNVNDLEKCMAFLRNFHGMGLIVEHVIDIFGLITFYESLWMGKSSLYKDYMKTKENVFSLKAYIDDHRAENVLAHMDAAPDKFLFIEREDVPPFFNNRGDGGSIPDGGAERFFDKGEGEELFCIGNRRKSCGRKNEGGLQLVGWEYAGMQDPHVDVAMFCINALYDKERVDRLVSIYFGGDCPEEMRIKIYCYIAACGLLRSNWCEYRMKQGEEFGEYSLRQYRYAKEFYRIASERLNSSDAF